MGVGVEEGMAPYLRLLILLTIMGILAWAFFKFTRWIVKGPVLRYVRRSKATWDDLLMDNNVLPAWHILFPLSSYG